MANSLFDDYKLVDPRQGQPDYAEIPSPHPIFGRKPGLATRIFSAIDGEDRRKREMYWPTYGDLRLFYAHMRRHEFCLKAENEADDLCQDPGWPRHYDPLLASYVCPPSLEWERRMHVYDVVRKYRDQQGDQRKWWERLPEVQS